MKATVDYTNDFPRSLLVQGSGSNVLMLSKLDRPQRRFDGKVASYELEYRWLSSICSESHDQAYACVLGSEITFWQRQEIEPLLRQIKSNRDADLFQRFNLF